MTRRTWIWQALAVMGLGACRNGSRPLDIFPETAAQVWRRTSLRDVPASEAPDPVPQFSVTRMQTASYEGPGKLEARVYELTSAGVGLDLVQRWRPSADTVFFNQGRYLVVVKWQQADRQALQAFVRDLEKRVPGS